MAVDRRSPRLPPGGGTPTQVADSIRILEDQPAIPLKTPASASAPGFEREYCADDNYFYVYRNGGWKRSALSSW